MSVCGQTGQTEEDSASEEVGASATREREKQKPASKVVRVLTVLAYLLSVSLAAILLSVYYICVWRSPELPLAPVEAEMSARRDNLTHQRHVQLALQRDTHGGGDTAVNEDHSIHPPPQNITDGVIEDSVTEPSTNASFSTVIPDDTTQSLDDESLNTSTFNDTDSIT